MEFTTAQKQVIDERNRDILVSAAAGSGKTAVLVERIIARITDENDPIDIDRILVVTFTKAAAKEMRERIYKALEDRSKEDPDNERLQIQMSLLNNAAITTIDGFCSRLIKNHFHEIGLDPAVHVGDDGELALLSAEIMDELLEDKYKEADEDFLDFANAFSKRDRDDAIAEMVSTVYTKSRSYPYPGEWTESLKDAYDFDDEEGLLEKDWMKDLVGYIKIICSDIREEGKSLLEELTAGEEHPYAAAVASDLDLAEAVLSREDYAGIREVMLNHKFARLSGKKLEGEAPEEREALKARRTSIKNALSDIAKELCADDPLQICNDMKLVAPKVAVLVSLVSEYGKRFSEAKQKRGIMDFADLELFALSILIDEKTKERTETAAALSEYYEEILVDEYQDSNYLQEILLKSLSKEEPGRHDYFMVGDVKQSIYRFRQARPDIFIGKYSDFCKEDPDTTAIDLDANFRSRREVTDSVNAVFSGIMRQDMGGVEYDERASLKCRAVIYPEDEEAYSGFEDNSFKTEIIIADKDGEKEGGFINKHAYEAAVIAGRIQRLLKEGCVVDKETGTPRRVKLSDIVILHRSANSIANIYQETLSQYDIPAFILSTTGYFKAVEVEGLLALLKILDNPMQDIALAAALKSAVFGITDDMLAAVAAEYPEERFYNACALAAEMPGEFPEIAGAMEKLAGWREKSRELKLYDLLTLIIKESGYMAYIAALPGGDVRKANVEKLLSLAIGYEETSYRGLFNFTRYIEKLKTYEQDFGQEIAANEGESVSIMTIHKSKGLEFPIVFLAGMGQQFVSEKSKMVLHSELGVGFPAIDTKRRTRKDTLFASFLHRLSVKDDKGEGLRVLYVAMTRAKEKLIMTGVAKDAEGTFESTVPVRHTMSLSGRMRANSYFSWVLPMAKDRGSLFDISVCDAADLVAEGVEENFDRSLRLTGIAEGLAEVDDERLDEIKKQLAFEYAHPTSGELKVKYSVSELKHASMPEEFREEGVAQLIEDAEEEDEYIPEFYSGEKEKITKGSDRGTAMHRYMECFDFTHEDYADRYEQEKERMINAGLLKPEDAKLLNKKAVEKFLGSDMGLRMHRAALSDRLKKEAAFVMGDTPGHFGLDGGSAGGDLVLIQGIIDVFFEEEDSIVLLDYKTDRIHYPGELILRYKKQIELYADAIERTCGKPVKEKILYSFALDEVVVIE